MQTVVKNISDYRPVQNPIAAPLVIPETTRTLITSDDPDSVFFRRLEENGLCLNRQQLQILNCEEGNVVVNALPGSGKSTCLTALITYLTHVKAVSHHNILALAYSKKASLELHEKLLRLNPSNSVSVYTLHSLCYRIVRSNGFDKHTLVTDDRIRFGLMKSGQFDHNCTRPLQPEDLLTLNSYYLNTMTEATDPEVCKVLEQYRKSKAQNKLLDFDDLLVETLNLLEQNPRLLSLLRTQFKFVIVDEAQDLNNIQFEILKLLSAKSRFYAIGDKNQSIFGFCGSFPKIMDKIVEEFTAKELPLDVSFRCSGVLLSYAHKILGSNEPIAAVKMGTKPMLIRPYSSIDEAKYVRQKIFALVSSGKRQFKDFAVLYRSSVASVALIDELLQENIPFRSNNSIAMPYSDNMSVFLASHLRLISDRSDVSALQGILSSFYLSKATAMPFLKPYLESQDEASGIDLLRILQDMPGLKDYQYELLERRTHLLDQVRQKTPTEAFKALIRDKDIKKRLGLPNLSSAANKEVINEISDRLLEDASQYASIKDYLCHVDDLRSKYQEHQNKKSTEDSVQLMTIHSSKGLDFSVVFIIGAVDGILPHQKVLDTSTSFSADVLATSQMSGSLDEERRLLYVAVTRAKDELTISAPLTHNGNPSKISRFLVPFADQFVSE